MLALLEKSTNDKITVSYKPYQYKKGGSLTMESLIKEINKTKETIRFPWQGEHWTDSLQRNELLVLVPGILIKERRPSGEH